jgi:hypothetical protein
MRRGRRGAGAARDHGERRPSARYGHRLGDARAVRQVVEASGEQFHVADPADMAAVIAYLASDLGWLITGNVIQLR